MLFALIRYITTLVLCYAFFKQEIDTELLLLLAEITKLTQVTILSVDAPNGIQTAAAAAAAGCAWLCAFLFLLRHPSINVRSPESLVVARENLRGRTSLRRRLKTIRGKSIWRS